MVYSDSHSHLDSYPQEDLDIVFAQMKEKNVALVLNVSINRLTSEESVKLARAYDNVFAAIGIHPGEAISPAQDVKTHLEELCKRDRVVAIGEVGLEYGRPGADRVVQKELFTYQFTLAGRMNLPVDIHYSLDAHQDIMEIIRKEKRPDQTGIVHGFLGDMSVLRDWLELGFYISLGQPSLGLVNDPMARMLPVTDEVVRAIPRDKLLTETDSMARMSVTRWGKLGGPPPPPATDLPEEEEFRQPSDVVRVAEKVASIMGVSAVEIGDITTANFKRILKI